jgi:hypothetical protein
MIGSLLFFNLLPFKASADEISITLTDLLVAPIDHTQSILQSKAVSAGCLADINVTNNTESRISEISGSMVSDVGSDFETKDVPAHGQVQVRLEIWGHSCKYTLYRFQQHAAHQQAVQLDKCAMEAEREGDCMRMVAVYVESKVTPEMAEKASADTEAMQEKVQQCIDSKGQDGGINDCLP